MKQKKSYIEPKIKAIPLNQESAILQVCQVGGAYFGWGPRTTTPQCGYADTSGGNCRTGVRGIVNRGYDPGPFGGNSFDAMAS